MDNFKTNKSFTFTPVAYIRSDFDEKFGIPRQSSLTEAKSEVVFEPEYADEESVRRLESYNYIWLIWIFSENVGKGWHMTVRPPKLGGNKRVGIWASRSPFRPNPIGLSCVRLESVQVDKGRVTLHITGADLMNGTPVLDVKPYLAYTESHPDSTDGFQAEMNHTLLTVEDPGSLLSCYPEETARALSRILAEDPRPHYQHDPDRVYGMKYGGKNVRFRVCDHILTILDVEDPVS